MSIIASLDVPAGRVAPRWATAVSQYATTKSIRWIGWSLALMLGAVHSLGAVMSQSMNPDGVAYLDIGDAYLRGDWHSAISAYWSPMYSWILGATMRVVRPSMRWEFPTVHLVNFLIYVVTLIAFERFWQELGRSRQSRYGTGVSSLSDSWWWALGYGLFLYASLNLIRVWSVTPDMLVAAVVYAAAGLIVRVRTGRATNRTYALLGALLGFGYLTKTAMFPMAFVFLGATLMALPPKTPVTRVLFVTVVFLLAVAGPYVGVLSVVKGRPTFGDTGKLMYAWHVNRVPHPHWQGEIPGAGTPIHGSRQTFDSPPIYVFDRPSGGTYPIAYDPAYWYEGVSGHFEWAGQARVLALSAQQYFDIFFRQQAGLIVALLVLYCLRNRHKVSVREVLRENALVVIAASALVMYAIVYVEGRYIGAFVVLLWAELLAAVRLPPSRQSERFLAFIGAVMVVMVLLNVAAFTLERGGRFLGIASPRDVAAPPGPAEPRWPGEVAQELHQLGVQPGAGVATIGYAFDSYWARLARVQIMVEMFGWDAQPFWSGTPSFQAEVLRAISESGAKAIVAERVLPTVTVPAGWHRVGHSSYYIYIFGGDPKDAAGGHRS